MPEQRAHVDSVDALEAFRTTLLVYVSKARPTVEDVSADVLRTKLSSAGAVTFASAAALTLGVTTLPVYEIYKAGHAPVWLEGLNLLEAATGLRAAVIPHYDNAEGGHHDFPAARDGSGEILGEFLSHVVGRIMFFSAIRAL